MNAPAAGHIKDMNNTELPADDQPRRHRSWLTTEQREGLDAARAQPIAPEGDVMRVSKTEHGNSARATHAEAEELWPRTRQPQVCHKGDSLRTGEQASADTVSFDENTATVRNVLRFLPFHAADYIDRFGWTQNRERDDAGRVNIAGALRYCTTQPGVWAIAFEVFCRWNCGRKWNNEKGRTQNEVTALLRSSEITDRELALTFGPSWEITVAAACRAAAITTEQRIALILAKEAAGDITAAVRARQDALYALQCIDDDTGAIPAAGAANGIVVWQATRDAVTGAAARFLIGQHGFTQEHYDALTRPWRTVMGPLHPGDVDLRTG